MDCESQTSDGEDDARCPASKSDVRAQRESRELSARASQRGRVHLSEPEHMDTEASAAYRDAKKAHLVEFYRDFYARNKVQTVSTNQYTASEKSNLSIKDGHRYMPRPSHVDLPADHKEH